MDAAEQMHHIGVPLFQIFRGSGSFPNRYPTHRSKLLDAGNFYVTTTVSPAHLPSSGGMRAKQHPLLRSGSSPYHHEIVWRLFFISSWVFSLAYSTPILYTRKGIRGPSASGSAPGGFVFHEATGNIEVVLLLQKMGGNIRGGAQFNRIRAWETAVKRGKGGFPGPTSWDPMDEEALRLKAEALLAPEVCSY